MFSPFLKPLLALGSSHTSRRAAVVFAGVIQESWLLRITPSENALHCFEITRWKKALLVMWLLWSFTFLLSEKQHGAQP